MSVVRHYFWCGADIIFGVVQTLAMSVVFYSLGLASSSTINPYFKSKWEFAQTEVLIANYVNYLNA